MPCGPSSMAAAWVSDDDRRLRRGVVGLVGAGALGAHARHVDDCDAAEPVAGGDHRPGRDLGRDEHRAGVDVHHEVPLVDGDVEQRRDAQDAGVVDQDVDAAEVVDRAGRPRRRGAGVGEVDDSAAPSSSAAAALTTAATSSRPTVGTRGRRTSGDLAPMPRAAPVTMQRRPASRAMDVRVPGPCPSPSRAAMRAPLYAVSIQGVNRRS